MTSVTVNGRSYRVPDHPVVVITVDGGDPRYFRDGLHRGILPRLQAMLDAGGAFGVGVSEMPSLTNPNNMSIVTGAPPAVHGLPGNYMRTPEGELILLNDPKYLRAPSIHSCFERAGVATLAVTTKDKLRLLLGNGDVPSVSVERAAGASLPSYGVASVEELVGEPAPGVYDTFASHYAMRLGLAALRVAPQIRLLYISFTDRVQHEFAPGEGEADAFFVEFDRLLGEYLDAGVTVAITADHGMNPKHDESGQPRVHYLRDVLDAAGVPVHEVVLPITDPYVRHHGSLGSFAWIYLEPRYQDAARSALGALRGVEELWDADDAAVVFQLPRDRIGDLTVTAAADTVLGTSASDHDLGQLHRRLRSHGGRHEQPVPLIVSRPVVGPLAGLFKAGALRNRDIHDLVLNHL